MERGSLNARRVQLTGSGSGGPFGRLWACGGLVHPSRRGSGTSRTVTNAPQQAATAATEGGAADDKLTAAAGAAEPQGRSANTKQGGGRR